MHYLAARRPALGGRPEDLRLDLLDGCGFLLLQTMVCLSLNLCFAKPWFQTPGFWYLRMLASQPVIQAAAQPGSEPAICGPQTKNLDFGGSDSSRKANRQGVQPPPPSSHPSSPPSCPSCRPSPSCPGPGPERAIYIYIYICIYIYVEL